MLYKIILHIGLCILLLSITSCNTPAPVSEQAAVTATKAAQVSPDSSEVVISLGDKQLTMQQVELLEANASPEAVKQIADYWLTTELLYEEAMRRGFRDDARVKFLTDFEAKRIYARELARKVGDSVEVAEQDMLDYYEKNKETDRRLKAPLTLSFSHVKTNTLQEAETALERIKNGADINTLARELSIHRDAKNGGKQRNKRTRVIKRFFGPKILEFLLEASKGDMIGPVKVDDGYEIVRHDGKKPVRIKSFEETKDWIKDRVMRQAGTKAVEDLIASLNAQAADRIVRSPKISKSPETPEKTQSNVDKSQ